MKITDIECFVLRVPELREDATPSALRVCHMAQDRGRLVVPHRWKTGIGIAASAHLAFAVPHCPFIEFLPTEMCDSALRRELVEEELNLVDGRIYPPSRPGLGIELNEEALRRYRVA